jgi:hypothetical protein
MASATTSATKPRNDSTTGYDLHATILHLLGIDHEKLTVRTNGVDRRLTDVHGHVVKADAGVMRWQWLLPYRPEAGLQKRLLFDAALTPPPAAPSPPSRGRRGRGRVRGGLWGGGGRLDRGRGSWRHRGG